VRQIGVLSVLLAAALVGSYLTWTADESSGERDEKVVVYRANATDVERIAWDSEELTLTVERETDALGEYVWVTVTERTVLAPPEPPEEEGLEEDETPVDVLEDESADDAEATEDDAEATEDDEPAGDGESTDEPEPTAEPEIETRIVSFKGNKTAEELWEDFAPLYALRELGELASLDAGLLGLDEPTATLEVVRRSGPVELLVGGETYGSKDRYLGYGGQVFLVDDSTLRPLQYGKTRLVERRLHPLDEPDVEQIAVTGGATSVAFVHQNADDPGQAYWAAADAPDIADEGAATWIAKLSRLRVHSYATAEEAELPLQPSFSFVVGGGGESWSVDVLVDPADDQYYARPSWNRSMVKLTQSLASEVVADLETVLPEE